MTVVETHKPFRVIRRTVDRRYPMLIPREDMHHKAYGSASSLTPLTLAMLQKSNITFLEFGNIFSFMAHIALSSSVIRVLAMPKRHFPKTILAQLCIPV